MGLNARRGRCNMAVSAFTVANIKPSLNIDSSQRFVFGLSGAPEPLGSFKLDNIFVPTISAPSQTNFEHRNNTLSGFRWIHGTTSTDTFGSLKLQSFLNASPTGTDIWSFNQDGSITVTSPVTFTGDVTFSGGGGGGGSATWADLGTPSAPVDFGGQKLLNVGTGSTATDGVNLGQVQNLFTNLTLTSNKITDFAAAVAAFRLDQFAAPTASLNLNSQKIINLLDPTLAQDAATKNYIDTKTWTTSQITNFSAAVLAFRLDQFAAPTTSVSMNSQKIINLLNPTANQDASTKNYVDTHLWAASSISDLASTVQAYSLSSFAPPVTGINMSNQRMINLQNPVLAQDAATKVSVETFVNAKTWTTSQITDFATAVSAFRLDQFAAPTAALNINSQNLNNISSLGILTAAVGSGRITFSNAINNRKIALYDAAGTNDDYNYSGFGASATDTIYNCPSGGSHTFYTGSNTNYAAKIKGSKLYLDNVSSTTDFRKSIFWTVNDNPHQVVAIGNSPKGVDSIMRFQVPSTSSDFVFYSGIDSTSSYEAMRLTGTGLLGIGIFPKAPLHFAYTSEPKIILYGSGDNTHQYFGFAIDPNTIRYQSFGASSAHVFYSGTSATTSSELARITAAGELIVQNTIYGRRPSACLYMRSNATGTTVSPNAWTKANGTTTSLFLNGFSMPTSNRLQNITSSTIYAIVIINALISHSTGATTMISLSAYKNGALITGSDTYDLVAASGTGTFSATSIVALDPNDYLEAYVASTGATTITPKSLTITAIAT